MKHKVEITYEWWGEDGNEVKEKHREALEETARSTINRMRIIGYTAGELHDNICMTDGEDGIEYSGWWSMTTKVEA